MWHLIFRIFAKSLYEVPIHLTFLQCSDYALNFMLEVIQNLFRIFKAIDFLNAKKLRDKKWNHLPETT